MIEAKHKKWAELLFDLYINREFIKHFSNFYIVNDVPTIGEGKLIVTPNHFSWWDGFLIYKLNKKLFEKNFYILMLEDQLKRYWFFKFLGAFSINQSNSKSVVEVKQYINNKINEKSLISIYPQGKMEVFKTEDIEVKEGLKYFINNKNKSFEVLPIAFKIQYYENQKPAILCRFGTLLKSEEIIDNYNIFINEFINNIKQLDVVSKANKWELDIL